MTTNYTLNKISRAVTQDITQGASQAMLYAIGMTKKTIKNPQIGICSVGFDGNPSNNHLDAYATKIKKSLLTGNNFGIFFLKIFVGKFEKLTSLAFKVVTSTVEALMFKSVVFHSICF